MTNLPSPRWRGRLRVQPHFVAVGIEALDRQVLGGSVLDDADLDRHVAFDLHPDDLLPLAVVQVGGDFRVDGDRDPADLLAVGGQGQQPHDVDGHALGRLDDPRAGAVGAVLVDRSLQAGSDPLASHLDEAEGAHAEDLGACAIALDGLAQGTLDPTTMALFAHVDEVVDDHAAQVAEPELSRDLARGPQVHLVGGPLGVVLHAEVPRVHVDGDQGFGLVDDDRAAFRQRHMPALDLGDLVLDAVLVKQGDLLVIEFQPVDEPRHDDPEEVLCPLEGRGLVDPDRIDLRGEDVADGPDDHVRFLIDRRGGAGLLDAAEDHLPEPQEIGEVSGQLALGPLEAGGPDDEAQTLGGIQLEHDLAELPALPLVDDLARDADAIEPGHQHEVSAGDADVGRTGSGPWCRCSP